MIKLSANPSKKVSMPDVEFSSQQYGAAMEVEVSDAADAQEITGRLEAIYKLLEKSIDQQIVQASTGKTAPARKRPCEPRADQGNVRYQQGQGHGSQWSHRVAEGRIQRRAARGDRESGTPDGCLSRRIVRITRFSGRVSLLTAGARDC